MTTELSAGGVGLSREQLMRLGAEIATHRDGPIPRAEMEAALDALDDDYRKMRMSVAMWQAWEEHLVRFDVIDGEMRLYATERSDAWTRPGHVDPLKTRTWARQN